MSIAYLSLGSNTGDRRATLERALEMLHATPGVTILAVSTYHRTEPVGPSQEDYLNSAMAVRTDLSPGQLLDRLNEIEAALGRDRAKEVRWGPRTCDIDILMIDDVVIRTDRLTIPHPRMHERRFVLDPLTEIAPMLRHPVLGKTVAELLAGLGNQR